jgi:hypothetical protein
MTAKTQGSPADPADEQPPVSQQQKLAQKLDQELDRELDETFPASDPLPWSHEVK